MDQLSNPINRTKGFIIMTDPMPPVPATSGGDRCSV